MRSLGHLLAAVLALAASATAAPAVPVGVAPGPAPLPRPETAVRCTADGSHCIRAARYLPDLCRAIEATAAANALDSGFFARLLWRESLFDAAAVSPAGAQGIAQFMPETARRRGLADAFNPAEALAASAAYLAELRRDYGNLGLAAAAYNAGEAGLERFLAARAGLPAETRAYVRAITGHSVETWRDAPPDAPDLALAAGAPFQAACVAYAARARPPVAPPPPWGVVVATSRDDDGAERQVARLRHRFAALLDGEPVAYARSRRPGMARALVFAQVGRDSRAEAEALCARLRAAGADCLVLRN